MGKLSRLIGLATQALDLDSARDGDRRSSPAGSARPGAARTPPAPNRQDPYAPPAAPGVTTSASSLSATDRSAIARYDYLMQTADPHQVEQIHREAFSRLTPAQRAQVQERMSIDLAPHERPASASPDDLARAAGRAEAAKPGRMRGLLSRVRGAGAIGVVGGATVGVLGAVAGGAVLSTVAGPLLAQAADLGVDFPALAEGLDADALLNGVDVDGLSGAAEGFMGSAGEAVSGLGETASGWGEKLGDLGLPGIRGLFGR